MTRTSAAGTLAGAVLALGVLAGCASPKVEERFHTLLGEHAPAPATEAGSPVHVDVLPIAVPAQVDHAQWVVRQADGSMLVLEQDRWAATLPEELRSALVERLATRWNAIDVRVVGAPAATVPRRVRIDVQRFDSVPGREARVEATWSLALPASTSPPREPAALVCRSVFVEAVGEASIGALAAGHRRNVRQLADAIGERLRAAGGGGC